ncbi:hypothetical protein OSB04_012517 [Centaurea solstitialis]|uniref:Spen paralogue and orthologue SPOC C-terminal domain-containing protein n=1 Tax=Centaurea solstitialis TaxID=347529 RepID=A0AA38TW92_9ASTR|nr:hypothetical protein OSB04_012517 [Centaurea solstitialis]
MINILLGHQAGQMYRLMFHLDLHLNVSFLGQSNLQDGRYGTSINQPMSMGPVSFSHQFDNQFHQQNNLSGTRPTFNANPCGNGEKIGIASHNMFLSANHGLPMITPPEMGTPEYLRLVEILHQSSVQSNGFSDQLNGRGCPREELSGGSEQSGSNSNVGGTKKTPDRVKKLPSRVATEKLWEGSLQLSSSVTLKAVAFFKSGEKLVGNNWPEFIEVKGKVRLEAFEKYVQDLPRSRNRGLMVRCRFHLYYMYLGQLKKEAARQVISVCWKEGSSELGLTGMKEVAKGYKKSSRVGFAQLLSGIDLYLCPRSDPIITILAKYGFFKGMAVLDDKPDSMIGCVVWRKNRPLNPVVNTSDGKTSPNSTQVPERKPSPENPPPEPNQRDEPVSLPSTTNTEISKNLASVEVDHNGGNSSSSSSPLQNPVVSDSCHLVKKRAFEDDDLPEFDFGTGKSTVVNSAVSTNNGLAAVNDQKLDGSRLTQLPNVVKIVERKTNNGCLDPPSKKSKLFDDDDDDMPEWCPPELLHNQLPPTSNFQTLPPCPPRPPPILPLPRADIRPPFSYQPFRPAISSPPTSFMGPPLPPPPPPPPRPPQSQPLPSSSSGRFNPNPALWHRPGSSNVNSSFPSSNRRRSRP